MSRRLLRASRDGSVEVLELVVSKFSEDVSEEREGGVRSGGGGGGFEEGFEGT